MRLLGFSAVNLGLLNVAIANIWKFVVDILDTVRTEKIPVCLHSDACNISCFEVSTELSVVYLKCGQGVTLALKMVGNTLMTSTLAFPAYGPYLCGVSAPFSGYVKYICHIAGPSIPTTTTITTTTVPTSKPTYIAGLSDKNKGDSPQNYCCKASNDCKGFCISGKGNAPLNKGDCLKNYRCKTSNDCKESHISGKCNAPR